MSRPPVPTYAVDIIAPDEDYPAGGDTWNGNATKVIPPGATSVGFTPAQGNAAQYHNYLHNLASQKNESARATLVAIHNWIGLDHIRNWGPPQASIEGAGSCIFVGDTYYLCGTNPILGLPATFARTKDPWAWTVVDEIDDASIVFNAGAYANFDVKSDKTIVIPGSGITDGAKVLECNASGTWAVHAAVFPSAMLLPDVVYEPVSGNWIVAGGVAAIHVSTSTDRVSWTSRTAPASVPTDAGNGPNVTLGANKTDGIVVAQLFPSSIPAQTDVNSISFSRSTDGGVTWSAVVTKTTTFATSGTGPFPKPLWTGSKWVAVVQCNNVGNLKTHVYNSTNGSAWTEVAVLTTAAIKSIACDGDFLVGLTSAGDLIFSLDFGATWKSTGMAAASTYERLQSANGGFVLTDLTDMKIKHSFVRGGLDGPAVT